MKVCLLAGSILIGKQGQRSDDDHSSSGHFLRNETDDLVYNNV